MLSLIMKLRTLIDEVEWVDSAIVGGEGAELYIVVGSSMIQKRSV